MRGENNTQGHIFPYVSPERLKAWVLIALFSVRSEITCSGGGFRGS